ncbi:MAG: DUF389 domain-containing protein [Pseudonocardiaceae bacterium]
MLHLRVICPAEVADGVLERLRADGGTAHLTIVRGAAVAPPGDLVQADIAREVADGMLAALCELGVDHTGGITLEPLDTVLSDAADAAQETAPGDEADAVVWDRAMVVGPEFAPLAAVSVGLVLRRWDLVRRAALALGVGFPAAMLITGIAVLLGEWTGLIAVDPLGSADQVDFIFDVGPFSFIVAMLAGAAGMLSIISAKSAALVGVFISVTTVPAAAAAVVAATTGDLPRSLQSATQLLVNLVGIVLAAALVLALRTRRRAGRPGRPLARG